MRLLEWIRRRFGCVTQLLMAKMTALWIQPTAICDGGGLDVITGITTGCCRTGTITTGCSSTTMCHELIRHARTLKYDGIGSSHNLNHGRPRMVVEKDGNHHVTGKFHIHHFIIARLNHLGCRTIMKQTKNPKTLVMDGGYGDPYFKRVLTLSTISW